MDVKLCKVWQDSVLVFRWDCVHGSGACVRLRLQDVWSIRSLGSWRDSAPLRVIAVGFNDVAK